MSGFPDSTGAFRGFALSDVPQGVRFVSGKVRDLFVLEHDLVIVASDRISAFDRILGLVPGKGEVLTRLSEFWFRNIADIVDHHLLRLVGSRAMHVKRCEVLPVEVVVRGYLTGSAWRDYRANRPISGIRLPEGLRADQKLETPLVTPSTKEAVGSHDRPISSVEIVSSGLVDAELWQTVEDTALALFARGQEICARSGLILVDTKYEFGLRDGRLTLVDEIHTPDSSRFWYADEYKQRFERGELQRKLDKEHLRAWLLDRGFQGDGDPPEIPSRLFGEVAERYIEAFETITGTRFLPDSAETEAIRQTVLLYVRELQDHQRGEQAH